MLSVWGLLLGWLLGTSWPGKRLRLAFSRHPGLCNYTVSEWMQQRVRVLCLVATQVDQWGSKTDVLPGLEPRTSRADGLRDMWWARCDHLLFLSSQPHPVVPTLVLNTSEAPWPQIRTALEFIVNKTEWRYDWILKVDDKAFVVVENLRLLLRTKAPYRALFTVALTVDHQLHTSAGYVISREAARKLVAEGRNHSLCRNAPEENDGLVLCMTAVDAQFFIAKDSVGLPVFYELPPEQLMEDVLLGNGVDRRCSAQPALFHGLQPAEMQAVYYLLYRLRQRPPPACSAPTWL